MAVEKERLLRLICETSFTWAPDQRYRLASGKLSEYYIDCKKVLSYPEARSLLGKLALEQIDATSLDAVGGLELGAYPIAIAISDAYYRETHKTMKVFIVRKQPKPHGLKRLVEGDVNRDDRVLIVDDVITTGDSTIDAIRKAREEGLKVSEVLALVDRQEANGAANIENQAIKFKTLFTMADLRRMLGAPNVKSAA